MNRASPDALAGERRFTAVAVVAIALGWLAVSVNDGATILRHRASSPEAVPALQHGRGVIDASGGGGRGGHPPTFVLTRANAAPIALTCAGGGLGGAGPCPSIAGDWAARALDVAWIDLRVGVTGTTAHRLVDIRERDRSLFTTTVAAVRAAEVDAASRSLKVDTAIGASLLLFTAALRLAVRRQQRQSEAVIDAARRRGRARAGRSQEAADER